MSVSHRYRNFGGAKDSTNPDAEQQVEALEEQKLQAFETGYQAGWDDATKAQSDQNEKARAEFCQNLQDMSFTYHEALTKLTVSMEPVMEQIVAKLLPELVSKALGAHILEQVGILIKLHAEQPAEIVVAPTNKSFITEMIGDKMPNEFLVVGDDSLREGQAFVRIAESERQVDLDAIVQDVSEAFDGFFQEFLSGSSDG